MGAVLIEPLPDRLANDLLVLSQRRPSPVSIEQLYQFGENPPADMYVRASQFLHMELPVRLALMIQMLQSLPGGLSEMPSIRRVLGWYTQSFADMRQAERPTDEAAASRFTDLIEAVKERHARVVETIADGIGELKAATGREDLHVDVQSSLDRFYTARIAVRLLIGQHAMLKLRRQGWVGIICRQMDPVEIGQQAAAHATHLCNANYSCAPKVEFVGNLSLRFMYIPSHLYHILFELLKNSMRAVVETHRTRGARNLPPIRVIIADGSEDVAIKVADEGGGIPRSGMPRIWTYLYTTARRPAATLYDDEGDAMAGYGYGLPLARLYARFFGGDLQMISMEGYGTDAFIHLSKLGAQRTIPG